MLLPFSTPVPSPTRSPLHPQIAIALRRQFAHPARKVQVVGNQWLHEQPGDDTAKHKAQEREEYALQKNGRDDFRGVHAQGNNSAEASVGCLREPQQLRSRHLRAVPSQELARAASPEFSAALSAGNPRQFLCFRLLHIKKAMPPKNRRERARTMILSIGMSTFL